jgi:hypothetical protein
VKNYRPTVQDLDILCDFHSRRAGRLTVARARKGIIEHWPRICAAMKFLFMADKGRGGFEKLLLWQVLGTLPNMLFASMHGKDMADTARRLCHQLQDASSFDVSPDWLIEWAPMNHEVPWLMVNHKPAPGFSESAKKLHWGSAIMKPGKSQFMAAQTRAVAHTLFVIEDWRRAFQKHPFVAERMREAMRRQRRARIVIEHVGHISSLPPLSVATKQAWWPIVRDLIRDKFDHGAVGMTRATYRALEATANYKTANSVRNEFMKRCRRSFNDLVPTK